MTEILRDIWKASVKHRRDALMLNRREIAKNFAACPDESTAFAQTLAAWLRVLDAEINAFEASVALESVLAGVDTEAVR